MKRSGMLRPTSCSLSPDTKLDKDNESNKDTEPPPGISILLAAARFTVNVRQVRCVQGSARSRFLVGQLSSCNWKISCVTRVRPMFVKGAASKVSTRSRFLVIQLSSYSVENFLRPIPIAVIEFNRSHLVVVCPRGLLLT